MVIIDYATGPDEKEDACDCNRVRDMKLKELGFEYVAEKVSSGLKG